MSLNICTGTGRQGSSTRHEAVAIEGIDCPACEAIEERDRARDELASANRELRELRQVADERTETVIQDPRPREHVCHTPPISRLFEGAAR